MKDDRNENLDPQSNDDNAEIDALRLKCITHLITARPITVRLVGALLTQSVQPERRKRRSRSAAEEKGAGA